MQSVRETGISDEVDEGTQSENRHEIVRQLARQHVQRNIQLIRDIMMRRGGRAIQDYHVGDIVRLNIPGPDRRRLGRMVLPCKVMEVLDGGWYNNKLGCSVSILDTHYQAGDLEASMQNLAN